MSKTNPARGMRDFLPADVRKREYVIGIIKEVYESYGFEPLETPAVENIETLMGKYGEEGNQLMFKILKRGEKLRELDARQNEFGLQDNPVPGASPILPKTRFDEAVDLALRYDLTVPLARVVANRRNDLPKFFKRYQIQPVWRADRPARGRFREFWQCDVDVIGSSSMIVEVELISAVSEILTRLGFQDFTIRINHRLLLSNLLAVAGVNSDLQADVLTTVDKLDKIGLEGIQNELESKGFAKEVANRISFLFDWKQDAQTNFEMKFREAAILGLTREKIYDIFANHELDKIESLLPKPIRKSVIRDQSLARGLSYYSGTIMELSVRDLAGSLGGGGRYDGLIGMFGKEQIPACGFSLGLERILMVMDERGMFPPEIADSTPADVMVTIWNEDSIGESLKLANELRQQGLRVTVYPEADKMGKQLKYADSIKVSFVCILGETELADNIVTLKNMETGEQETLPRSKVASRIKI